MFIDCVINNTMEDDNAIIKHGEEISCSTCVWQPCSPMKVNTWGVSACVFVYVYICICMNTDAFKIHIV